MLVRKITIQGFKSFKKKEALTFPDGKGFFFLTGRNELHPELGANGAGKSTLWDALIWVLFGKTARGLRSGNVANWQREHMCAVKLWFEQSGTSYMLARTWDPITLNLTEGDKDPTPITQEELEKLIGCDFTTFTNTAVMGQFGQYFFDMTPTEKLDIFSRLFDLTFWLDRSRIAATKASDYDRKLVDFKMKTSKSKGFVESMQAQVSQLGEASAAFVAEKAEAIASSRKLLAESQESEEHCRVDAEVKEKRLNKAKDAREDVEREIVKIVSDVDAKLKTQIQASSKCGVSDRDIQKTKGEISRVSKLSGTCPTCYSDVTAAHCEDVVKSLNEVLSKLQDVHEANVKIYEKATKELDAANKLKQEASQRLAAASREEESARSAFVAAQRALTAAKGQTLRARDALKVQNEKSDPYALQLLALQEKLEAEKEIGAAYDAEIEKLEKLKDRYMYWSKGFKDLRLWVIERALLDLEVCVNNSLNDLGLTGWSISFDVERSNTAGGVSKGFSVFIKSPDHDEPCPWESWSGGETQRLRIAGSIGLAEMIAGWRGFRPSLEVWDEPTAHLSRDGISDLLAFFKTRARKTGRQVWLVDHRSLAAGEFDGVVTVTRDELGSHITMELADGGE